MESIIDKVINELVWRLTNSGRSSRAAAGAGFEQPQVPTPAPAEHQPQPTPPPQQMSAPQPQIQPEPTPAPEPTPPEPTEVVVERELQRVVAEARQELDAAAQIVIELRASADGFSERIAATGERLDSFDSWIVSAPRPQAPVAPQAQAPAPAPQPQIVIPEVAAPAAAPPVAPLAPEPPLAPQAPQPVQPLYEGAEPNQFAAEAAVVQTRTISLTVAALSNLTVVSVVEAALLGIPGVREVALRQLQGRKAILEVRLDEGTGLISGLRKALPLAFDVTESSDHSLEITLSYAGAQPQATNGGGGAGTALA